ncbi:MAG: Proteasome-activating nucleotidase [Methanosaeta sp. PtaB.Bin005]|nr:MAG: Proteasome-activating nucleotidase [Methanosaeta sp. PtaB.Bin005]
MRAAEEIIEEEEQKRNNLLARDLRNMLYHPNNSINNFKSLKIPVDNERGLPLLEIKKFKKDWTDLVITTKIRNSLESIIEENNKREILAVYGLKPKKTLLFFGPPGCGKTLTAQVLSGILGYPMIYIRFDGVISSYLGETAGNLRKIFDFIKDGRWIIFFDEFDVIGKQRDDPFEHGEMKRVVNNFLQMIDNYSGESIIICATNHQHLLDPALWRRFDDIILFDIPNKENRIKLIKRNLRSVRTISLDYILLADNMKGMSPADIEMICLNAIKRNILDGKGIISMDDIHVQLLSQKERIIYQKNYTGAND